MTVSEATSPDRTQNEDELPPPAEAGAGALRRLVLLVSARPCRVVIGYRIGIPDSVRAITRRWISLVPSKIV